VSVGGGSFENASQASVARDAIQALGAATVVVNRDEAGLLAGAPQRTAIDAAAALATADRLAVVTDGPRGAAAAGCTLSTPISCPAPEVRAVDATGAGDALTAALLARLVGIADAAWPPTPTAIGTALIEAVAAGGRAAEAMGAQTA
jgi:sugar/nucleoside kinase (ribokinase family)